MTYARCSGEGDCRRAPSSAASSRSPSAPSSHSVSPAYPASRSPAAPSRQQQPRAGVLQHEGQPLGRVLRVQRHVRAPGLEDAEHRDHHLRRALHAQAHRRLRPHAAPAECPGDGVRAPLQLRVGEDGAPRSSPRPRPACAPPAPRPARGCRRPRDTPRPSGSTPPRTCRRSASGSTSMLPIARPGETSSASTSRSSAVCIIRHTRSASAGAATCAASENASPRSSTESTTG